MFAPETAGSSNCRDVEAERMERVAELELLAKGFKAAGLRQKRIVWLNKMENQVLLILIFKMENKMEVFCFCWFLKAKLLVELLTVCLRLDVHKTSFLPNRWWRKASLPGQHGRSMRVVCGEWDPTASAGLELGGVALVPSVWVRKTMAAWVGVRQVGDSNRCVMDVTKYPISSKTRTGEQLCFNSHGIWQQGDLIVPCLAQLSGTWITSKTNWLSGMPSTRRSWSLVRCPRHLEDLIDSL